MRANARQRSFRFESSSSNLRSISTTARRPGVQRTGLE
jgi:hypothetical protein